MIALQKSFLGLPHGSFFVLYMLASSHKYRGASAEAGGSFFVMGNPFSIV